MAPLILTKNFYYAFKIALRSHFKSFGSKKNFYKIYSTFDILTLNYTYIFLLIFPNNSIMIVFLCETVIKDTNTNLSFVSSIILLHERSIIKSIFEKFMYYIYFLMYFQFINAFKTHVQNYKVFI